MFDCRWIRPTEPETWIVLGMTDDDHDPLVGAAETVESVADQQPADTLTLPCRKHGHGRQSDDGHRLPSLSIHIRLNMMCPAIVESEPERPIVVSAFRRTCATATIESSTDPLSQSVNQIRFLIAAERFFVDAPDRRIVVRRLRANQHVSSYRQPRGPETTSRPPSALRLLYARVPLPRRILSEPVTVEPHALYAKRLCRDDVGVPVGRHMDPVAS